MNTTNKILLGLGVVGGGYLAYNYWRKLEATNKNPIILPPALPKQQYVVGKDKATLFFTPQNNGFSSSQDVSITNDNGVKAIIQGNKITVITSARFVNNFKANSVVFVTETPEVELFFENSVGGKLRQEADLTKMVETNFAFNTHVSLVNYSVTSESLVKNIYDFVNNNAIHYASNQRGEIIVNLAVTFYAKLAHLPNLVRMPFEREFSLSRENILFNLT